MVTDLEGCELVSGWILVCYSALAGIFRLTPCSGKVWRHQRKVSRNFPQVARRSRGAVVVSIDWTFAGGRGGVFESCVSEHCTLDSELYRLHGSVGGRAGGHIGISIHKVASLWNLSCPTSKQLSN